MPEGPEIRRAADELAAVLRGRVATRIDCRVAALKRRVPALAGQRIVAVDSRAKAMLIRFEGGRTLYSHNQLYGRWSVVAAGAAPQAGLALRLAIHTATHTAVLYSATEIELLDDQGLAVHPYLARLGPDLLAASTTRALARARAEDPRYARRTLATLLLDQGFYAGPGNYLRSEILHVARLSPAARLGQLDRPARRRLADCALALTWRAYRTGGVTNAPGRVALLQAQGLDYERYRHHVYAREGLPCWECATPVVRSDLAGRAVYYCPGCVTGAPPAPAPRRPLARGPGARPRR